METAVGTLKTLPQWLALIVVVWGWAHVNRQNNARERRKELRQLVDRAIRSVNDASDCAIRFHGATSDSPPKPNESWRLLMAMNQVGDQISLLEENGLATDTCFKSFIRMRQAATGSDFQTAKYNPWKPEDPRWMTLLESVNSLTIQLDAVFFALYSPTNSRKAVRTGK